MDPDDRATRHKQVADAVRHLIGKLIGNERIGGTSEDQEVAKPDDRNAAAVRPPDADKAD